MNEQTERMVWLDIAKALGMLCIVLGHTLQGTGFLRQYTYAFSVPFFFLLSGITHHLHPAKAFYVQKLRRIAVPYLFFALISILLFRLFGHLAGAASTQLLPNLLGALYANSRTGWMKWNVPLWFLPCLLGTTCMVDLWERLLVRSKAAHADWLRGLFACICTALFAVLTKYHPSLMLPLQLETSILMAAFMELGILFAHSRLMSLLLKTSSSAGLLLAMVCLLTGGVICCFNGYADIRIHRFGESLFAYLPGALLISIGMMLLAVRLSKTRKAASVLAYTGRHTLGILLMHKFPILVFQTLIPVSSTLLTQQSAAASGILWACVVSVITVSLCLLVEKAFTPLLPWAFGHRR